MRTVSREKFLFPVLATLIGCCLALLLLEIVLRVASLAPSRGLHSVNENTFEEIPGIWVPLQDFVWTELPALPYHVRINSLGYRGSEIPLEKPAHELRIFVAGDSYTFGSFVDNDETLPAQLESSLAGRCTSKNLSIINSGVLGSTIRTQVNMIERGLVLEPDLIVLVFHNNDIENLVDPLWDRIAENRANKSKFPVSIIWPLVRNTASWNFYLRIRNILRSENNIALTIEGENQNRDNSSESIGIQKLKDTYTKDLYALAERIDKLGIEFVFVVYPGSNDVRGEPFDDLPVWAEQTGVAGDISTLNLTDALRKGLGDDVNAGFSLPHDGHPSKLGYDIAGEALANYLWEQTQLKVSCR